MLPILDATLPIPCCPPYPPSSLDHRTSCFTYFTRNPVPLQLLTLSSALQQVYTRLPYHDPITPTLESNEKNYHHHSHLPLLLLVFLPPIAPPNAFGSTVLYPLLSSLTLFFLRGGLCSSITTTSSLPPRLRLRLLSCLTSRLSSTMIRSTGGGGLTILTGLLSLRTSTVSDTRRDLVDPPCRDLRCSRTTTDSVYEESDEALPKFKQVYINHRISKNPPTEPNTMPTTVPGEGPELMLP